MKRLLLAALLSLGLAAAASPVLASGYGANAQVGVGSFDFDVKPKGMASINSTGDVRKLGLGFVYDTNLAKSDLLNYRLVLGYDNTEIDPDDSNDSESMNGLSIDNTLGIGLVTNQTMRLWAGPELKVGYMWGDGDGFTKDSSASVFGIGGAVGLNMHLGMDYDLAFTAGVRNDWINGTFKNSGIKGDFDGTATYGYFTITFLWRSLDDKFGGN